MAPSPVGSPRKPSASRLNSSFTSRRATPPKIDERKSLPLPNLTRYSPNPARHPSQGDTTRISALEPNNNGSETFSESSDLQTPTSPSVQLKDAILESLRKSNGDEKHLKEFPIATPEHRTINHAKELNLRLEQVQEENFRLKLRIYFIDEKERSERSGASKDNKHDVVHLKVELEQAYRELTKKNKLLEDTLNYLAQSEKRNEQFLSQDSENKSLESNIDAFSRKVASLEKQIALRNEEIFKFKKHTQFIKTTLNQASREVKGSDSQIIKKLKEKFEQAGTTLNLDCQIPKVVDSSNEELLTKQAEKIKKLQAELTAIQVQSNSPDESSWSSNKEDANRSCTVPREIEQELNTLHKAVDEKTQENKMLLAERDIILNESRLRAETFIALIDERNSEIAQLKDLLDKSESDKIELQKTVDDNQTALDDLDQELVSLQKCLDSEREDKNRILTEAEVLDQLQVEKLEELSVVLKQKIELELDLKCAKELLAQNELRMDAIHAELALKEKSLEDSSKELKETVNEVTRLAGLYTHTRSALDAAEKEMFLLKRQVSSEAKDDLIAVLKRQVEQKDKELSAMNSQLTETSRALTVLTDEWNSKTQEWSEKEIYLQKVILDRNALYEQSQIGQSQSRNDNAALAGLQQMVGDYFRPNEDDLESFSSIVNETRQRSLSADNFRPQSYAVYKMAHATKSDGDVNFKHGGAAKKMYKEAFQHVMVLEETNEGKSTEDEMKDTNKKEASPPSLNTREMNDRRSKETSEIDFVCLNSPNVEISPNRLQHLLEADYTQFGTSDNVTQLRDEIVLLTISLQQLQKQLQNRTESVGALSSSKLGDVNLDENSLWEPSAIAFDGTLPNFSQHFLSISNLSLLDKSSLPMDNTRMLWLHMKQTEDFLRRLRSMNDSTVSLERSMFITPEYKEQLKLLWTNVDSMIDESFRESFSVKDPNATCAAKSEYDLIELYSNSHVDDDASLERSVSTVSIRTSHIKEQQVASNSIPHSEATKLGRTTTDSSLNGQNPEALRESQDKLLEVLKDNKRAINQLSQALHTFGTKNSLVIGQLMNQIQAIQSHPNVTMNQGEVLTAFEAVAAHLVDLLSKMDNLDRTVVQFKDCLGQMDKKETDGTVSTRRVSKSGSSRSNKTGSFSVLNQENLQQLEQEMSLIRVLSDERAKDLTKLLQQHQEQLKLSLQPMIEYLKCTNAIELQRATQDLGLNALFELANSDEENGGTDAQIENDLVKWTNFISTLFGIVNQNLKNKNVSIENYVKELAEITSALETKDNDLKNMQGLFDQDHSLVTVATDELLMIREALTKTSCRLKSLLTNEPLSPGKSVESIDESSVIVIALDIKQLLSEISNSISLLFDVIEKSKDSNLLIEARFFAFETEKTEMEQKHLWLTRQVKETQAERETVVKELENVKLHLNDMTESVARDEMQLIKVSQEKEALEGHFNELNSNLEEIQNENIRLKEDCDCLRDSLNQAKKAQREKDKQWDVIKLQTKEEQESKAKVLSQNLVKKESELRLQAESERDEARKMIEREVAAKLRAQTELEQLGEQLQRLQGLSKLTQEHEVANEMALLKEFETKLRLAEENKEELRMKLNKYKKRYSEVKEALKDSDMSMKMMKSGSSLDSSPGSNYAQVDKENAELKKQLEEATETISILRVELRAIELLNHQSESLLENVESLDGTLVTGFLAEMRTLKEELLKSLKVNEKLNFRLENYSKPAVGLEHAVDSENSTPVISLAQSMEILNDQPVSNSPEIINSSPLPKPQQANQTVSASLDWFTRVWNEDLTSSEKLSSCAGASSPSLSGVSSAGGEGLNNFISSTDSVLHSRVVRQLTSLKSVPALNHLDRLVSNNQYRQTPSHLTDEEPVRDLGPINRVNFNRGLSSVSGSFSSQDDLLHPGNSRRSNYSSPDLGIESDPNREQGESTSSNASSTETNPITLIGQQQLLHNKLQFISAEKNNGVKPTVFEIQEPYENSQLRASAAVEDFVLLKKELSESLGVLEGLKTRVKDRISILSIKSPSKSLEYSTLKEVDTGFFNMQVCLKKGSSLVQNNFVIAPQNDQPDIVVQRSTEAIDCNLKDLQDQLKEALLKVAKYERKKEMMGRAISLELNKTSKVLKLTKSKLSDEQLSKSKRVQKAKPVSSISDQ